MKKLFILVEYIPIQYTYITLFLRTLVFILVS